MNTANLRTRLSTLFFVARRYIFSKSQDSFVGFISRTSMIGIALGVAILIIVLSVMNGFAEEFQRRVLGNIPHAFVAKGDETSLGYYRPLKTKILQEDPAVESVSALTMLNSVALAGSERVSFVQLMGVDPSGFENVSSIPNSITEGSFHALNTNPYTVVLGRSLANMLGVGVGDKVRFLLPRLYVSLAGFNPVIKQFTVIGIFDTHSEIDKAYALIHIRDAARLNGKNPEYIQGLYLRYKDVLKAPTDVHRLRILLGEDYRVTDWSSSFGSLHSAIRTEKHMVTLLLFFIILVASFNVLATLVMIIKEKQGEIAVLKTLGMSSTSVVLIFVIQGMWIGLFGCVVGLFLGVVGALSISDIFLFIERFFSADLLNSDTYFINYLPAKLELWDVLLVLIGTMLIAALATIYPAYRTTQIEPTDILS